MKKIAVIIILAMAVLCSCSDGIKNDQTDTRSLQPADQTEMHPMSFDTIEKLTGAVFTEDGESIMDYFKGQSEIELNKVGYLISSMRSLECAMPNCGGRSPVLRDKEGLSNIVLFANEQYDLPWIFLYPVVSSGQNYYIKWTVIPESCLAGGEDKNASEIISMLSPDSPNVGNVGSQHKSIENVTVQLGDREVTAVSMTYNNDSRNSIVFVYDRLLVEVRCDTEEWTDSWFAALSFGPLQVKQ